MANVLLRPALLALGPLRIPGKFLIIAVVFLVAAVVPTILMVSSQNAAIRQADLERQGIAFFKALFPLARHVMLHRLALDDPKDPNPQERKALREGLEASIAQDLEQLARVDQRISRGMETEGAVRELHGRWLMLLAEQGSQHGARAHTDYLASLQALVARLEDTSRLITDPSVEDSYLIDLATVRLPDQANRFMASTLLTLEALRDGTLSEEEKEGIHGHQGAIQALQDVVKEETEPSRAFADRMVAERLGGHLKAYEEATKAFLACLGAGTKADSAAVLFAGKEAVRCSCSLQEVALLTIEELLTARIEALQRAQRRALAGSLAAALLAFYLLGGLYAGFREGFREMGASLGALAVGDLTRKAKVASRDEFGTLAKDLDQALEGVGRMVDHIQKLARTLTEATAEISKGSEALARRTESQAASLEETSTATETLSATVAHTGARARTAGEGAARIRQLISDCSTAVASSASAIQELNAASGKVVEVAGVVEDLAFQANLSSVDAVLGAAAGKVEQSFTALASKVHDLGRDSAAASARIKAALQETLSLLASGSGDTAQAAEAVRGIVGELTQVTAFIQEMTAAAEEQATGLHQISSAMNELGNITLRNAAMAEASSEAAEALAHQAKLLAELAGSFRTGRSE